MKLFSTIILLFSLVSVVKAQSPIQTDTLKTYQLKRMAKNAVRFGDTYAAIAYYEDYLKEKPNRYDLKLELADLYRKARDYQKAEIIYKEVYINAALKFPDAQFYYARMLKANEKYIEAKQEYTKFLANKGAKTLENIKQLKKLATIDIQGCDAAIELGQNKNNTIINHFFYKHINAIISSTTIAKFTNIHSWSESDVLFPIQTFNIIFIIIRDCHVANYEL